MGFIEFMKDVGASLLGQDDEEVQAAEEKAEASNDGLRARSLARHVKALGLEVEDLSVEVDGGTCCVKGVAADQATKEKVVLAVGNTVGIGVVDDQLEVAGPKAVYYTVESGDSLSKIAKEHYGEAGKYHAIFEANRPMLEHPDRIYPGQVLRIPPVE